MGRRAVARLAGVSRAPGFPSAPTYRAELGSPFGCRPSSQDEIGPIGLLHGGAAK